MITPSSSLAAHQQGRTRRPAVSLSASPSRLGSPILNWSRIYRGPEPDHPRAATLTASGHLLIVRNNAGTLQSANRYSPGGSASPSGVWTNRDTAIVSGSTPALINRANGETLLLYAKGSDLKLLSSSDNGATWAAPATLVTEASPITHIAAAFRTSSSDCAVFYGLSGAPTNLRRLRRTSGTWDASSTNWTQGATIAALYELAAAHDGSDYVLTFSALAASTNHPTHFASLSGDLGFPGIWSAPHIVDQADAASTVTLRGATLATLSGRLIAAYALRETSAVATITARETSTPSISTGAWAEPQPFEPASQYGPAYATSPTYPSTLYAVTASGVWAATIPDTLTLTTRLLSARLRQTPTTLTATLTMDDADGGFAALGLAPGWTVTLTPGYASGAAGAQEAGIAFILTIEAIAHTHAEGHRIVTLTCTGPLEQLARWRPASAYQSAAGALTRFQLLLRAAQRAAIPVASGADPDDPSPDFTAYSPSLAWAPGESGRTILDRILAPLNDGLRTETGALTVVNRTSRLFADVARRLAPILWWRFTTYDATVVQDHSATGAYAGAFITPPYTIATGPLAGGQPSTALTFPATPGLFVSTSPTLAPSLTHFTLLALVRNPAAGANRTILASDNSAGTYWHMGTNNGVLNFGNSADGWTDTRGADLRDGNWHLVAVTRQANSTVTWYVDGVPVGTRASASAAAIATATPITVGIRPATAGSFFIGATVAEAMVFDKLLIARDIADLWRAISPALYTFGGPTGHPIEALEAIDQPPPANWIRLQGSARQAEAFAPESLAAHGPRLAQYRTLDATTDTRATSYAANRLRHDTAEEPAARLTAPWATGPQLFDHIAVTHPALSQASRLYRVNAIALDFARGPAGHRYRATYDLVAP